MSRRHRFDSFATIIRTQPLIFSTTPLGQGPILPGIVDELGTLLFFPNFAHCPNWLVLPLYMKMFYRGLITTKPDLSRAPYLLPVLRHCFISFPPKKLRCLTHYSMLHLGAFGGSAVPLVGQYAKHSPRQSPGSVCFVSRIKCTGS